MNERVQVGNVKPELCLRRIQEQVANKKIDPKIMSYLGEQAKASNTNNGSEGFKLECQIGNCAAKCVMVYEKGTFRDKSESGTGLCE